MLFLSRNQAEDQLPGTGQSQYASNPTDQDNHSPTLYVDPVHYQQEQSPQSRYLPVYGAAPLKLMYAPHYERFFHPFADVRRMPWNKLKLFEGDGVEGVTYFTTRKQVLLTDDTEEWIKQHENRHCSMPDMLERENHAWDRYEGGGF